MSSPYLGTYTNNLFVPSKRYKLNTGGSAYRSGGFVKGCALADAELREISDASDSFVKQLISNNFKRGSSTNNGFKVVQSSVSTADNFTIKGGDGFIEGAGVLFVDGYILFLKGDIEYSPLVLHGQGTGTLIDDFYTTTSIPNMPAGPGTLEVYVDFYFAEVSANAGSEYIDPTLQVSGIGSPTANRVRQVQDIRCTAIGGTTPIDYLDGNSIWHRCIKIATIIRDGSPNITTSMITDNRTVINSIQSFSDGTATGLLMADGATIGNDTHRISTIYMASAIDYKTNSFLFSNNGTERIRITTGGNVGIGTNDPGSFKLNIYDSTCKINLQSTVSTNPVYSQYRNGYGPLTIGIESSVAGTTASGTAAYAAIITNSSAVPMQFGVSGDIKLTIDGSGRVGIGSTQPEVALKVVGDSIITGALTVNTNLTVNGTTTTINTETTTTDKLEVDQDEDQEAVIIKQITPGNSARVLVIENSGYGAAATFVGVGTSGAAKVGIGTTDPTSQLDVRGGNSGVAASPLYVMPLNVLNQGLYLGYDASGNGVLSSNGSVAQVFGINGVEKMRIASNGVVGIGTLTPYALSKLDVWSTITVSDAVTPSCVMAALSSEGIISALNSGVVKVVIRANGTSYFTGGNVGIGTSIANGPLQVRATTDQNFILNGNNSLSTGISINSVNDANTVNLPIEVRATTTAFTVGNVGIGTTIPTAMLTISSDGGASLNIYGKNLLNGTASALGRQKIIEVEAIQEAALATNAGILTIYENNTTQTAQISGGVNSQYPTFFIGKVGIGTNNPYALNKLTVVGNSNFDGNVGIGITVPTSNLHVVDAIPTTTTETTLSGASNYAKFKLVGPTESAVFQLYPSGGTTTLSTTQNALRIESGDHINMISETRFYENVIVLSGKQVGIGTNTPSSNYSLHVEGGANQAWCKIQNNNISSNCRLLLNNASDTNGALYIETNYGTNPKIWSSARNISIIPQDTVEITGKLTTTDDIYTIEEKDIFNDCVISGIIGWSSYNTYKYIRAKKIGKTVHMWINIEGTSDSTTTNITPPAGYLPINLDPPCKLPLWERDATGSFQIGTCYADNGVIYFVHGDPVTSATSWTASGTKSIHCYLCYEAQ